MDEDEGTAEADRTDGDEESSDPDRSGAPDPTTGPEFDEVGMGGIQEHWDDLVSDVEATAAEFREAGWEVLELHTGDATVTSVERFGLDCLVPDDEFERLAEWVESGTFDEYDVYRAEAGLVFLLVVMRDETDRRAVLCPAYYEFDDVGTLAEGARELGTVPLYVRRLSGETVTFTLEEPELLLPDSDGAG